MSLLTPRVKFEKKGVVCKLHIEKAFNHVNWDLLMYIMRRIGFRGNRIGWIRDHLASTSFVVLVNCFLTKFFLASRGLCQGDLFIPHVIFASCGGIH